jgi:5-methylcytosine-specific restriction endonuclease McrA
LLAATDGDFFRKVIMKVNRRLSKKYEIFRESILNRDDYMCMLCGSYKKSLNVHHIWSYSENKELRYSIKNGITLCSDCHKKYHNKFGQKAIPTHWSSIYKNPESLQEFLSL